MKRLDYFAVLIKRNYLLIFILAFLSGTLIAYNYTLQSELLILCAILTLLFCRKFSKLLFVLILGFVLGMLRCQFYQESEFSSLESNYNKSVQLEAVVVSDPKPGNFSTRYVVRNDEYGKILISVPKFPLVGIGESLELVGKLEEPPEFSDFSYKDYLKTEKIYYVMENPDYQILDAQDGNFFRSWSAQLKQYSLGKITKFFPEPHASLLKGLILGTDENMPEDFSRSLQVTGTTHIIAVSGYNVGMLIVFLFKFSKLLSRKLVLRLIPFVLIFFAFLIGLNNYSAMRAILVGFVFIVSNFIGRPSSGINSLAIVCLLFILVNPYILNSLSFQLSVAATFGILSTVSYLSGKLSFFPDFVREDLAASIAATIFTLPIILINFESFSVHALLVNMIVLPFLPLVMSAGIIFLFLSVLGPVISNLVSWFVWGGLEIIISSINWFGNLDWLFIEDVLVKPWQMVLFVVLVVFFLFEKSYRECICKMT